MLVILFSRIGAVEVNGIHRALQLLPEAVRGHDEVLFLAVDQEAQGMLDLPLQIQTMKPFGIEHDSVIRVRDRQNVRLQTYTARPVIFEDVAVRVSPDFASYVHLDYDEANSCGFRKGDLGRILP